MCSAAVELDGMAVRDSARGERIIVLAARTASSQHRMLVLSACLHAAVVVGLIGALALRPVGLLTAPRPVAWVVELIRPVGSRSPDAHAVEPVAMTRFDSAIIAPAKARPRVASLTAAAPRRVVSARAARGKAKTVVNAFAVTSHAPSPAAVPTPAPAAASVPPDGIAIAALEGRIGAAIDAVKYYPPSARQMRREGRALVGLTYRDGSVADIALRASTSTPALDAAALAAVRDAHYPGPPQSLIGRTLHLILPITFLLDDAMTE